MRKLARSLNSNMHSTWVTYENIYFGYTYTQTSIALFVFLRYWHMAPFLPKCMNMYIHGLRFSKQNKAIHDTASILISNTLTRSYTLSHASTQYNQPCDNILPSWLLPCECYSSRYIFPATLRPNIMCVLSTTREATPSSPNTWSTNPTHWIYLLSWLHYIQDTKIQPSGRQITQLGWQD